MRIRDFRDINIQYSCQRELYSQPLQEPSVTFGVIRENCHTLLLNLRSMMAIPTEVEGLPAHELLSATTETPSQISPPIGSATNTSPFLKKLPPEIRNQIYELVLVNPDLATLLCISENSKYGEQLVYDVGPGLLRTCKQINLEATPFLYEKNIFIMTFTPHSNWRSVNSSPLTRYSRQNTGSAISKVRNWKIVIDPIGNPNHKTASSTAGLSSFCRTIFYSPPKSMEILLGPVLKSHSVGFDPLMPQGILKPFHSLRNLDNFSVRDAALAEIPDLPDFMVQSADMQGLMQQEATYGAELRELVKGKTPVEFLVEMHKFLVSYTVAFERYEAFRQVLSRKYGWQGANSYFTTSGPSNFGLHAYIAEPGIDLVHEALCSSKTAVENFDAQQFKMQRAFILGSFEEQFQSILTASRKMVEFIKEHKAGHTGLFYPRTKSMRHWRESQIAECLVHLEDYNDALRKSPRNMPFDLRVHRKGHQQIFQDHYGTLPADAALRQLNTNLSAPSHYSFFELFRAAFDDLDSQYLEIVRARKQLYKWDTLNDPGCDIGVDDAGLCDETVDWDALEPELGPKNNDFSIHNFDIDNDSNNADLYSV